MGQEGRVRLLECRVFAFDMDGTLTRALHDFDAIRAALDLPVGAPILEQLAALPAEIAARKHAQLQAIEYELALAAQPNEGAAELLELLRRSGFGLGIVTRNSRVNVHATLRAVGFAEFFPDAHIISRDDAAPKPSAAGLLHIGAVTGCAPRELAMIGDYRFDLESGRNAGAYAIHYAAAEPRRWPEFTDLVVESFDELRTLVDAGTGHRVHLGSAQH